MSTCAVLVILVEREAQEVDRRTEVGALKGIGKEKWQAGRAFFREGRAVKSCCCPAP